MKAYTIGRTGKADIRVPLTDGSDTVSERHAIIEPTEDGCYQVEDLNSSNGLFVFHKGTWNRVRTAKILADTPIRLGSMETTAAALLKQAPAEKEDFASPSAGKNLSIWGYFIKCYSSHYATFSGRATRSEYWGTVLYTLLLGWSLVMLGVMMDINTLIDNPSSLWNFQSDSFIWAKMLMVLVLIGSFLPLLSVFVRRMHDSGRSGFLYLLSFLPYIIGATGAAFGLPAVVLSILLGVVSVIVNVLLLIFLCSESEPHTNRYGAAEL